MSSSEGDSPSESTSSSDSEGDSSMSSTEGTSSSEDYPLRFKRRKMTDELNQNQTEHEQSSQCLKPQTSPSQHTDIQKQQQPLPPPPTSTERGGPSSVEEILNRKKSCVSLPIRVSSPESSIICVRGYKVKNNIAPILESIFKKQGDIAAECVFKTDCVRASFLELVCEVVMQLQTNDDKYIISKMEEIESKVSEAESANIHISWLRSYLDAFRKKKEAMEKSSLLLSMKANTSLVKRAAEMDLKERREELFVAQQKFKNAERCVKVLGLVEKKLHNNVMVSKTEEALWERPANVLD